MNPTQLLALFDRISEAPDAIPRLRQLILTLAVRGKLIEQDPEDQPAECLLTVEQRMYAKGAVQAQAADQPRGWANVVLGQLIALKKGKKPAVLNVDGRGLPYLDIAALERGELRQFTEDQKCPRATASDLVVVCDGSRSGLLLEGREGILGSTVAAIKFSGFTREYLRILFNSLYEDLNGAKKGAAIPHLNIPRLLSSHVALPPLAEQHRIVAKVDKLMAPCDRLEAAQAERENRRDRLVAASLHRVNNGADADAFREHARFHLRHLPRLTIWPEQIQQLRHTILNLGVRGRLVAQDPNDERASELLERIQAERGELIRSRALKKDCGESQCLKEDLSFDLPSTWRWAPLQSLIVFGPQNGISPKPSSRPDAPKAITLTATTKGTFDPNYFKQVEAAIPQDSEFWLRPGDLLFQRGNTREYVGIAAYYTGKAGLFLYPDLMMKVRLSDKVSLPYVHLCAVAPYARDFFSTHATGAQATMPKINQGTLVQLPIPLPSLAEQHRIVAKVNGLMELCDRLEAQLTTAAFTRHQLLEATIHQAISGQGELQQSARR